MSGSATAKNVDQIVRSLRERVETPVDEQTLTEVVEADFTRYDSARIKEFVPALVERDVREQLLRGPHTRSDGTHSSGR